jgi:transcriptional regulator with XRE-family HTH domain
MTQEELAGELNVTRQALSNWERDVNEPDLNMLKKICFLFGVNFYESKKRFFLNIHYPVKQLLILAVALHQIRVLGKQFKLLTKKRCSGYSFFLRHF